MPPVKSALLLNACFDFERLISAWRRYRELSWSHNFWPNLSTFLFGKRMLIFDRNNRAFCSSPWILEFWSIDELKNVCLFHNALYPISLSLQTGYTKIKRNISANMFLITFVTLMYTFVNMNTPPVSLLKHLLIIS